jgi:UDPglucose 6-dehydrogenase
MSIAYINEISRLCKAIGADVDVISRALLSERRISPKAPLKAGAPFAGGHLMRDILIMERLADEKGISAPIIKSIRESNEGK